MCSVLSSGDPEATSMSWGAEEKSRKTPCEDPLGAESYHTSSNQLCELDKESPSSYSA